MWTANKGQSSIFIEWKGAEGANNSSLWKTSMLQNATPKMSAGQNHT